MHVCADSILYEGMCMASPRHAPYSPRRPEGVARRTSPSALKTMIDISKCLLHMSHLASFLEVFRSL